ncbi:hypothetical protein WA026_002601 [Henosepilachna vigintioctopunctata]|uniref:non-specific serine/threonine protein kinase n=1 Tax=Henosepilachna vigintioctopunctata TaxID=420089 RepID=A0AAW1U2T9_9CUCU
MKLSLENILNHNIFKNIHFDTLRDQIPPFVPKISSFDDTSNFSGIPARKKAPCMENFIKKTQFSGRNLPKLEKRNRKTEKKIGEKCGRRKGERGIDKKIRRKGRKLESVESVRDRLEKDIANNIAECAALKRTLELERRDRTELEKKALDLIKAAKLKWETEEKRKVDCLSLTIEQQEEKIRQLTEVNKMLEEQVQHALKMEVKHKKSMETIENLSRRSVVGLETRLDKVTAETQDTIADLQGKLNEQLYQKSALERQISKLKDRESALELKLKISEDKYNNVNRQVDEAEVLIRDLNSKMAHLQKETGILKSYKDENQTLKERINDDKKLLKDLENRCTHLELENRNIEKLRLEIETLNEKIKSSEKDLRKMGELEIELQKEREKTKSLTKQIQETEIDISETQELRELKTKYWKMEKELNNAKIDKRILERELKEANEKNKQFIQQLDMQKNKMEENKKIQDMALLELNAMNESLSVEIVKLKEKEISLQKSLNEEKILNEQSEMLGVKLKSLNEEKEETIQRLYSEIEDLKIKLAQFEKEKIQSSEKLDVLSKEKVDLQNRVGKAEREHQNITLNLEALREACILLEDQVIALEKLHEASNEREKNLNLNTEKLISELCTAKEEIKQAKQLANEEKSYKLIAETKLQRMHEDIKSLKVENEDYNKQLEEYKQYSNQLSEELTVSEEKITDLEISSRSFERQIENFVIENRLLKEELSECRTELHKCREINYKLNHQLNELKENNNLLKNKVHDLDSILQEKNSYYKEREIKSESTIKQQIKLIDYLQTKIDERQNRKKTFTLFGHSKKENLPPISLPMNYKDLELQLQKERATNKTLQEEVYRLRAENSQKINDDCSRQIAKVNRHKSETVSPKMKRAMQKLVQSPCSQSKDLLRKNSVQRMHHNIPHRFESKLCTKPIKCDHCQNTIIIGRYMSVCKECSIPTHSNCSASVPSTCGLPQELVEHYQNIMDKLPSTSQDTATSKDIVNVESWIKIFGPSGSWEKRYAVLTNTHLKVYAQESERYTAKVEQIFELKPEDGRGKVLLEPLISEIDVMVAQSDLPFLLKIEISPNTTCWPSKTFIFLTLSVQDKDMWYKALQNVFQEDNENVYCETIMSLPDDLTVNCVLDLTEDIKALGTTKGLFCYYNGDLVFVEGFEEVHHIALVPPTKTLAMIVNAKNILITCDLNHLINVTQCTAAFAKTNLNYDVVHVKGLNGFHLLVSCKKGGHKMFCVATPKHLIIMGYNEKEDEFLPLRILDTAEPTGTVLFTEHSIIVGADKFFEIDIETFVAEEFLDTSNAKLQQVLKCYKMKSYPLSVVEVSDNPREYLVSFNEFSIFVDEYGSPSRKKEWTSKHFPIGVIYVKPYLYVVEFFTVEIRRITVDTCSSEQEEEHEPDVSRIKLNKFQLVGTNKRGIYVTHKNAIKLVEGRKCLPCDDSSLLETVTGEDSSDRFSFSTSMVQSLDGHLDENIPNEKNVTFTQTSL